MQTHKQILKRFPHLELSYEPILHKKVYADVYALIPKGSKALAWFTYNYDQNVCFIISLNKRNKIINIEKYSACFSDELALGTIIYGTYFEHNNKKHFTCENLYYYKGINISKYNYDNKLKLFHNIFSKELRQIAYTKNFIYFSLPIIVEEYNKVTSIIKQLEYPIYCVLFIRLNKYFPIGNFFVKKEQQLVANFKVTAQISPDVYTLYCNNNNTEEQHSIAFISSYKQSVMMNGIFRTIKENDNLDLLEESDDEEEFENISSDKFVDLNKSVIMQCAYISRFKKWQPIKLLPNDSSIIEKRAIF